MQIISHKETETRWTAITLPAADQLVQPLAVAVAVAVAAEAAGQRLRPSLPPRPALTRTKRMMIRPLRILLMILLAGWAQLP